jgi:hypothetical protein
VHTVWHDFESRFKDAKSQRYKMKGYDLITSVSKWAKKWPKDVRLVGIDDSYFCSSDLLLVEHQTVDDYMGTSVVVLPQCTGEEPIEFFLYPGHLKSLLGALTAIQKAARPVQKRSARRERETQRLTRKFLRHPAVIV